MTNITINVSGAAIEKSEIESYIERAREQYPDKQISGIDIAVEGEYVDLTYHWTTVPFERIRRIKGKLYDREKVADGAEKAKRGMPQ